RPPDGDGRAAGRARVAVEPQQSVARGGGRRLRGDRADAPRLMATDVIMPALGLAQETGKILRWFKAEGDAVTKGEPLLEIETDKVTVEVEAPGDGTLVGADVEGVRAQTATGSRWRTMAARVTRSWQEVPHFYLRREVDATALDSAKRRREGITHTDLLVQAVASALRKHPRVNASWREGDVIENEHVNVSVAVATEDGLVAPVVHDADRLDVEAIAERRREIVEAAREGRLRPEDVIGATITVSNLGMYGVDEFD